MFKNLLFILKILNIIKLSNNPNFEKFNVKILKYVSTTTPNERFLKQ